jgi:hypothetical protein
MDFNITTILKNGYNKLEKKYLLKKDVLCLKN